MFDKEDLELIYNSRPHAFKQVGEPYSESKQTAYVAEMVRQMKEKYKDREKLPATKIQAASTQAILDRDPATDKEHFNRPNPENWEANPNAKTTEERVGTRAYDEEQFGHHAATRIRPKNGIEYDDRSATTEESRERAEGAFMAIPGKQVSELSKGEKAVIKSLSKGGTYKNSIEQAETEETKRAFTQMLKLAGMAKEYGYAAVRITTGDK